MTARRIVGEVKRIHRDLHRRNESWDEGCDEKEALERWCRLCGPTRMDQYVFRFICDELRLEYEKEGGAAQLEAWQSTLSSNLMRVMLCFGMPMEKLGIPTFQKMNEQAKHAEETLLVMMNACARCTQSLSEVQWPGDDKAIFGAWLARIQGQRTNWEEQLLVRDCLSLLNLSECILLGEDLGGANLQRANLQRANLERANLERANLRGANLRGANLRGANLQGANLAKADLGGADLGGAYLERATLSRADLARANLRKAHMERSNLERANLREATLGEADLLEANLKSADLQLANLRRANLRSADLRLANLRRTNLRNVDLRDTNLGEADLEGVRWDKFTNGSNIREWQTAHNLPWSLKQQLNLN